MIQDQQRVDSWILRYPGLSGDDPGRDARRVSEYLSTGEEMLEALGPRSNRSQEASIAATAIHTTSRSLRKHFLRLYAEWLYATITEDYKKQLGLETLVQQAASEIPYLVPSAEVMRQEAQHHQGSKEGREIDQGLLFEAILGSPRAGMHLMETVLQPTAKAMALREEFGSAGHVDLGSASIERRGEAAVVTIRNYHCLNAEDNKLMGDLEVAVDLAALDPRIKVGVLRGAPMNHPRYLGKRVFSAGINLKALAAGQLSYVGFLLQRELGLLNKIFRGVRAPSVNGSGYRDIEKETLSTEKPWIAVVEGFAIGGGMQLLLVVDWVIAEANSYISLPAAREGIIPGLANLRLNRFCTQQCARDLLLEGRRIFASEKDGKAFFNQVVESDDIDSTLAGRIKWMASPSFVANRHMLNWANEPATLFLKYMSEFARIQAERLYSQDVIEKATQFALGQRMGSAEEFSPP